MTTLTTLTCPTSGLRVLLGPTGLPLLLHLPQDGPFDRALLEFEALHGWRCMTTAIHRHDEPGHKRAVEWAGKRALAMDYTEFASAPVRDLHQARGPDSVQACRLVGLLSYSSIVQLDTEWKGHPRGTWLVWAAGVEPGTGACGFVRLVGQVALIRALLDEREAAWSGLMERLWSQMYADEASIGREQDGRFVVTIPSRTHFYGDNPTTAIQGALGRLEAHAAYEGESKEDTCPKPTT